MYAGKRLRADARRAARLLQRPRLQAIQPLVQATPRQQLGVGPALANLAAVQDEDLVGADDGAEPMRDSDSGSPAHELREGALDLRLDPAVHSARRLVEDQHRR